MVIDHQQFSALHNEAKKHTSFESFRDEILRLTESVWHHHRAEATKTQNTTPDNEPQPVEDEADPGDANQDAQSDESPVIQSGTIDPVPAPPVEPVQTQPEPVLVQPLNPPAETEPVQPGS